MIFFIKQKVRAGCSRSDCFPFGREIPVAVLRKPVRNLRISVRSPDGSVTVTAPRSVSDAEIRAFLSDKKEWILKKGRLYVSVLEESRSPRAGGRKDLIDK